MTTRRRSPANKSDRPNAGPSRVRLLVGTRKGGYIVESDRARRRWDVKGPFQPGRDVFHVVADPRREGDLYAAVNSGYFGPIMLRSRDFGRRWTEIAPPMMAVQKKRPPPSPEGKPGPIVNVWHVEPGPVEEPETVFVGVDPASLYRSDDRGDSWTGVEGINAHPSRPKWNPGAGGMCLHTILVDPTDSKRMYVGISAAGTFRTEDGGGHWRPLNRGVATPFLPGKPPEVGHCVHHVVLDPADPRTAYRQDHGGMYVSHDRMESWRRIGKPLPSDFGFAVAAAPALPGNAFFVPLDGYSRTAPNGSLQVYRWNDRARSWSATIRGKPWPGEIGTHREALATDALDPAGIYLGTTTGDLVYSANGAKSWSSIPYHFPGIHSVSVASPPERR